jgi:hypothetical protein
MALAKAPEGGTDYDAIKEALLDLAKKEAKVVFRVRELHDPVPGKNGDYFPTTADMVVCSGPNKGKVLMNYRHLGKGITGPLRRAWAQNQKEVAARLELRPGVQKWVAAQTPNDDDFELISKFYGDGTGVWNGEPLVEMPEDEAASGGLARVGANDDSEPPF